MVERKANRGSAFFRGADGARQTEVELERQKQKAEQRKATGNMPFRFRVPVGETRRIIICDEAPDFFMYEHALKDAEGRWGRLFTGCVKTFDNCPVCEAQKQESYYAMFLTCIDLTPFTLRDGTEVEFSRKLLVVKPAQQKKFLRFFNKEGTLRGASFDMSRDGDKDSAIGNDIEFVEFVSEEEMESYTRSWKDRDGKRHTENCDEPIDYAEMFEEPTTEGLRRLVGGDPAPGSRMQSERELARRPASAGKRGAPSRPSRAAVKSDEVDDDWENDDDDTPFDVDEEKSRVRASKRKTSEEDADGEDEDAPTTRRRSAGKRAKHKEEEVDEEEYEEEYEEEDEEDEDEETEEAPPARRATAGRSRRMGGRRPRK